MLNLCKLENYLTSYSFLAVYVSYFCLMEKETEHIFKQTSKLFCKFGVKSVSMDDVARELGVSKRTIYQYIKDKEDLIEKSINVLRNESIEQLKSIIDKKLNAVEELMETYRILRENMENMNPMLDFEIRKYYPNLHRKLKQRHKTTASEMIERNIRNGIQEGLFRNDFDINLIVFIHYSHIFAIIETEESKLPLPWHETLRQTLEYHLRGICNHKGIEVLENYIEKTHQ